jgi:hypothetical protein
VHFVVVSNSNAGLFSVPPAIDATGNLTFTTQANIVGLAEIRVMLADDGGTDNGGRDQSDIQTFFIQIGFAFPLHNRAMPADVTGDNNVVAEDVLRVINYINAYGAGPVSADPALGAIALALAETEGPATPYYDVTGDDYIAADDAIAIINFINSQSRNETPTAEGEAAPTSDEVLMLLATDVASHGKRRK